jgi:hypothetical protein
MEAAFRYLAEEIRPPGKNMKEWRFWCWSGSRCSGEAVETSTCEIVNVYIYTYIYILLLVIYITISYIQLYRYCSNITIYIYNIYVQ